MQTSAMTIVDHRLSPARQIASPNQDERPVLDDISLLVIHCISLPPRRFGGDFIEQLFCNRLNPDDDPYFREICHLQVSAHLLIRRTGDILQFVPFDRRAWHAGVSRYAGRERCNDYSIGIELEGTEEIPYTERQYLQLSAVARALLERYSGLDESRIVGHNDIAPERKTDPGPSFDWTRFRRLLNQSKR